MLDPEILEGALYATTRALDQIATPGFFKTLEDAQAYAMGRAKIGRQALAKSKEHDHVSIP